MEKGQKLFETEPSAEYVMSLMARFSNRLSPSAAEGSSNSLPQSSGTVWTGDAWLCSKNLKHYPAFCRSGKTIPVWSFVFFKSKAGIDYLGYVEDLYEDNKGDKLVRVRRFNFREEMENRIPDLEAHSNEVFITSNEKVINAESIDGLATVLNPNHYEKCLQLLPQGLSVGSFMCHRQYRKNKINPFRLTTLRGYPTQLILSFLTCPVSMPRNDKQNSTEKGKGSKPQVPAVHDFKAPTKVSSSPTAIAKVEPNPEPQCVVSFKVNDKIEVLSQDSGLRGCWFRCKILYCSTKFLKVQHYDVLDVDGPQKLEERVPSTRVANPDILGMRCAGRLTVRPWPCKDLSCNTFKVGAAVDVWWCDGWWEGVVTGNDTSIARKLQVYLPGEKKYLTVQRKNIRVSRDWINNKWIDIPAKPDIVSFISSVFNPTPKLPPVPIFTESTTSSVLAKGENSQGTEGCSSMSAELKALEELYPNKGRLVKNNEDKAVRSSNAGNENNNSIKPAKMNSGVRKTVN